MFLIWLFSIFIAGVGVYYGLYRLWKRKVDNEIAQGARFEYQRLREAGAKMVDGISEEDFARLYYKTEVPRYPAYLLCAVAVFFLGLPITLSVLNVGHWLLASTMGTEIPAYYFNRFEMSEEGISPILRINPDALQFILADWAGFYYFFGLLFIWVGIFWFFMRRYHHRTPAGLREEILRLRMEREEIEVPQAIGGSPEEVGREGAGSNALGYGEGNGDGDDEGHPDREMP